MTKKKFPQPKASTPLPADALKGKGIPSEQDAKLEAEKEAVVQNPLYQQALRRRDLLKSIYDRARNPQKASLEREILDSNENVRALFEYVDAKPVPPPLATALRIRPPESLGTATSAQDGLGPGGKQEFGGPPEPGPSLDPMEQIQNETAWLAGKLLPYFEEEKQIREDAEEASANAEAFLEYVGLPGLPGRGPLPFSMASSDRGVKVAKAASLAEAGLYAEAAETLNQDRWPEFCIRMKLETLMLATAGLALNRDKEKKAFALALLDGYAKIIRDNHFPNAARRNANLAVQKNRIPDSLRPPLPSPPRVSPAPSADPAEAGSAVSGAKPRNAPVSPKPKAKANGKGKKGGGGKRR
ncbi:MAG: hypothetical protein LBQ12_07455 [Deltaproteobacteria bacterium]|jgi:hypothetical protein|nr:hypothetical protein [Deltaproteobacteria bacterium]